jgi:hypothetical protein
MLRATTLLCVSSLLWCACGAAAASSAAHPPIRYLAATPIQLHANTSAAPLWDFSLANTELRTDVDVVSVHEDAMWGVPWDHFLSLGNGNSTPVPLVPPPAAWSAHVAAMQGALADGGVWRTETGHGPFLTLTLFNGGLGGRSCPALNVTASGDSTQFVGPSTGQVCAGCYDFDPASNPEAAIVRAAHIRYVETMVRALRPRFLCHAPEINMYASACSPVRWAAAVDFANDVYDAAKAAALNGSASLSVFPSFQAAFLRGDEGAGPGGNGACRGNPVAPCVAAAKLQIEPLRRDLFALSMYPSFFGPPVGAPVVYPRTRGSYADGMGAFAIGASFQRNFSGYLDAVLTQLPRAGEAAAVAETGAIAANVTLQFPVGTPHSSLSGCVGFLYSDPALAAGWLRYLVGDAARLLARRRDGGDGGDGGVAWGGGGGGGSAGTRGASGAVSDGGDGGAGGAGDAGDVGDVGTGHGRGNSSRAGSGWELLTWWSDADFLPAKVEAECFQTACGFPRENAPFCRDIKVFRASYEASRGKGEGWQGELALKAFGAMGLREYDLTPRAELLELWRGLQRLSQSGNRETVR